MIHLYLVRHGIALDREENKELPDESRPLTAKGRRRFHKAAKAFARLGEPLALLFTSPLTRAAQTAEILAAALGKHDVGVLESLRPETSPDALLAELAKKAKGAESIGLVGHDPQMTLLVAKLGNATAQKVDFKKGAIVRIDVHELPPQKPAEPRYWLKPRSRMLAKGLPLAKEKPAPDLRVAPAKKSKPAH